jgi:hypothetical protein
LVVRMVLLKRGRGSARVGGSGGGRARIGVVGVVVGIDVGAGDCRGTGAG